MIIQKKKNDDVKFAFACRSFRQRQLKCNLGSVFLNSLTVITTFFLFNKSTFLNLSQITLYKEEHYTNIIFLSCLQIVLIGSLDNIDLVN